MKSNRPIFVRIATVVLALGVALSLTLAVAGGHQPLPLLPIAFLWAVALVAPAALFWRINQSFAKNLPQQPVLSPLFERPPPASQV